MKTDLFHLEILPIKNILPHEEFDISRSEPLVKKLKEDKFLKNPILVALIGREKYLELDGVNRFSSFRILKIPTILAQILDYNNQEVVELSSWSHVFKANEKDFLSYISNLDFIEVKKGEIANVGYRYLKEEGRARLCTLIGSNGNIYLLYAKGDLLQKTKKLVKVVDYYKKDIFRIVLPQKPSMEEIKFHFKKNDGKNFIIVFPTFTRHQIVTIVRRGGLLPPGVTRHIIKWRCLSVNIPLSLFKSKKTLQEKNKLLDRILTKVTHRIYEEPTIQFEYSSLY